MTFKLCSVNFIHSLKNKMELNLLHFMWVFYSVIVTTFGINVLYFESKTPFFLLRLYKFGKLGRTLMKEKSFTRYLEVPKRYFGHFYIFASVYFFIIALEVWRRYFIGTATGIVTEFLDIFTSTNRKGLVAPESVIVMSFLLLLQSCRRCYECYFVSVYSDGKMNIFHYIVGITFYLGAGQSLLCAAPGFESGNRGLIVIELSSDWLTLKHFIGIALFLFGFVLQYQTHLSLANLRKDDKGKEVVTFKHVMPSGGWFALISCPHYFAEIVMYFSANLILDFRNPTWWLLCLWVATNQVITGLLCHQWYHKTFKNYPTTRKAVVPYLL